MANILDYIEWRGDISLEVAPFNKVDNVIFSQLAYLDFLGIVPEKGGITIRSAAKKYFEEERDKQVNTGYLSKKEFFELLQLCKECVRFSDLIVSDYVKKIDYEHEMQFSALTIHWQDCMYVSYCGTDDTIVGWKEDFNMSVMDTVPSQREAKLYLTKVAETYPHKKIYVGGHSKGGNLAVYASCYVAKEVQQRILQIYNNDGPGFKESVDTNVFYQNVKDRITRIVPEASIVGMLMEHGDEYEIVQSDEKGLTQHNAFTWQVKGTSFIYEEDLSPSSQITDKMLKRVLSEMSVEQRESLTDIVFGILQSDENKTLSDIREDGVKSLFAMLKSYDNLTDDAKKTVSNTVSLFLNEGWRSIVEEVNQNDLMEQFKTTLAKIGRK